MADPAPSRSRLYRVLRDNLGSIRHVYLRGNRIVRRGDFARYDQTVLLLHGFFQTRNVWEVMEDRLRYDGFGVLSFDLGGLFGSLNSRPTSVLARVVAEKVERICERYGLERFHVLGHSQGGLIGRYYIQNFGGDRRVKSLITLGTPHHGTPTALLGLGFVAGGLLSRTPWELLPGSPLLRGLRRDSFPAGIPLVSIYSRDDLVCPYWCSILRPGPGEASLQSVCVKGVGHTGLTVDPGVYQIVRAHLRAASDLWRERGTAPSSGAKPAP